MDEELLIEELSHHEALLRVQRRNLRALELQAARHGPFDVPLPVQSALSELRVEIPRIERRLLALRARLDLARGVVVAEHPAADAQITFLATPDLAATERFYGGLVGLAPAFEQPGCRIYQVREGACLGFCQVDGAQMPIGWPIITIVTADVAGWQAHLARGGVAIEGAYDDAFHEAERFFVRDPSGYRIEVRRKDIG